MCISNFPEGHTSEHYPTFDYAPPPPKKKEPDHMCWEVEEDLCFKRKHRTQNMLCLALYWISLFSSS